MSLPNREKTDIGALVSAVINDLRAQISKKKANFSVEISPDTGEAWADPEKIKTGLRHLLTHALKSIQPKGSLRVRVLGSEKYVRIEIAGTNSEEFADKMRKIFDLFEDIKTDRQEQVGMWLALLRDVVELHRGKIWIEDEGAGAAKCVLVLPRDLRKKVRIVIADDNPDIRQTLKDILTEKEYQVDTVNNGYELIAYLRENNPKILILDMMMPEKDGTEVFNTIRSIQSNIKIIIYTGFQRFENSMYAQNAEKFLLKDENPEKLLQAIEELM